MKIVATIEARMTSTRLPKKVLKNGVDKYSFLEILIYRLKQVPELDDIVVATTTNTDDDPIESVAKKCNVKCFRGSEFDVLNRVLSAAKSLNADLIVETHADAVFVSPEIISQMIQIYKYNDCEYVKNFEPNSFYNGLEVQVFSTKLLEFISNQVDLSEDDKEHVSKYFRDRPQQFKHLVLYAMPSHRVLDKNIKLTLDTPQDLIFIREMLDKLYKKAGLLFDINDIQEVIKDGI